MPLIKGFGGAGESPLCEVRVLSAQEKAEYLTSYWSHQSAFILMKTPFGNHIELYNRKKTPEKARRSWPFPE